MSSAWEGTRFGSLNANSRLQSGLISGRETKLLASRTGKRGQPNDRARRRFSCLLRCWACRSTRQLACKKLRPRSWSTRVTARDTPDCSVIVLSRVAAQRSELSNRRIEHRPHRQARGTKMTWRVDNDGKRPTSKSLMVAGPLSRSSLVAARLSPEPNIGALGLVFPFKNGDDKGRRSRKDGHRHPGTGWPGGF